MSDEILDKDGLTKLGVDICGDYTVYYLTRKEMYISNVRMEGEPPNALAFL